MAEKSKAVEKTKEKAKEVAAKVHKKDSGFRKELSNLLIVVQ